MTSNVNSAILSAIEYYKDERFPFNELRDTAATVSGTQNYLMPDAAAERPFIRADQLTITINSNIIDLGPPIPHQQLVAMTTSATRTGNPSCWSYYQNSVWLYPIPNGAYTLTLWYVGQLAALSADADTNGWTTESEALIRTRAKWELYAHVIRDREMALMLGGADGNGGMVAAALRKLRGRRDMAMTSEITSWL